MSSQPMPLQKAEVTSNVQAKAKCQKCVCAKAGKGQGSLAWLGWEGILSALFQVQFRWRMVGHSSLLQPRHLYTHHHHFTRATEDVLSNNVLGKHWEKGSFIEFMSQQGSGNGAMGSKGNRMANKKREGKGKARSQPHPPSHP